MSNANRQSSTDIHVIYIYIFWFLQKEVLSSHNDIITKYTVTLKSMCTARYESVPTEGRDVLLFVFFLRYAAFKTNLPEIHTRVNRGNILKTYIFSLSLSFFFWSQIKNCKCRMHLFFFSPRSGFTRICLLFPEHLFLRCFESVSAG